MLPFPTMILLDRKAETAVYQQIANQLVKLIRDGIIQPGSASARQRELAGLLQVPSANGGGRLQRIICQDWIEVVARKGISVSSRCRNWKPKTFKAVAVTFLCRPGRIQL